MNKKRLTSLVILVISLSLFLYGCGLYNIGPTASFTANSTGPSTPLKVSFDASSSSDPDGSIDSYKWSFGDDSRGKGKTVDHTFESEKDYTVKLTVTDNSGSKDSLKTTISVPIKPITAKFNASPTKGDFPLEVDFDASDSTHLEGKISSYTWYFDDGTSGSGKKITHTFDDPGNYEVELLVTGNDGAKDTHTDTIKVTSPTNELPEASFTATADTQTPSKILFDATGSSDPDGYIRFYEWDFGDGEDGGNDTISHKYDQDGSYDVKLTVEDNEGATDSIEKTIDVETQ